MPRLEDEREGTLEFLEHGLDEFSEAGALIGLRVVDVLREDSDSLGIRLRFELVPALLKDKTKSSRVRHNTVVNDAEVGVRVGFQRVAVDDGGRAVSRPAGVRNRDLGDEGLAGVDVGLGDALAKASDLADLLEEEHLSGLVAINANSCGVVAAILLTGESVDEDLTNSLPVLLQLGQCHSDSRQVGVRRRTCACGHLRLAVCRLTLQTSRGGACSFREQEDHPTAGTRSSEISIRSRLPHG